MITKVYFIEGLYLYTEVGSSGRGVLASSEQGSQVQLVAPGCVKRHRRTPHWWWTFKVNIQVKGFKVTDAKENC
jgi:hypothetical protein